MVDTHLNQNSVQDVLDYDRQKELKAFDDTKAGVKGLIDSGMVKIPPIFVIPTDELSCEKSYSGSTHLQVPVIDLKDIREGGVQRKQVVEEIQHASETWGLFQIVNHGISEEVLDDMIKGTRRFHEQPTEVKREYYSRDVPKNVSFFSNYHLYKVEFANWRDTLSFSMAPVAPSPEEYPAVCRDIVISYSQQVKRLGLTLLELLSEGLGLRSNHLAEMECAAGHSLVCHYYPACPEPNRTMGTSEHTDPDFFTILLQDQIGGLQALYQNQWVDIPPVTGALVVNLGDLFQLISNDKFISATHRVLANQVGPRISVACLFSNHMQKQMQPVNRLYGPIKELLSDDNPPLYRETLEKEYAFCYVSKGLGNSALDNFRL
ncbi:1-aminocyclopropane-1-carboxylate oxidase homolog 1-like [Quercus lobata]|uniref:1-aminocyclopropane-1-carboxylate oxidase homolog 1-like n=1 Tax=Quercus lobata TaxID=97700 RepID=UPI001248609F|nr:1-aminocyclopropane-1-carboxylate oxidase homolog 1-like [Quercus lobata]